MTIPRGNGAPGAEKAGRLDLDSKLSCQEAFRAVARDTLAGSLLSNGLEYFVCP